MMKIQKAIDLIFVVVVLTVSCYFFMGEWFLPSDKMEDTYICTEYIGAWERITAAGSGEPVEIPVVFLTSVSDRQSIYSVLKSKPEGYILKPPDEKRIWETIEEILGEKENQIL